MRIASTTNVVIIVATPAGVEGLALTAPTPSGDSTERQPLEIETLGGDGLSSRSAACAAARAAFLGAGES